MPSRSATHRRTLAAICAACTAAVVALHFGFPQYLSLELAARDWLTTNPAARLSARRPDILYLGIDEASRNLDTLFDGDLEKSPTLRLMRAGFPWNRAVWAAVVDRLVGAGAKVVAFDMVVPAPRLGDSSFKAALDHFAGQVVIGSNLETRDENITAQAGQRQFRPVHVLPTASLIPPPPPEDSRVGFVNVFPDPDGKIRRAHFRTTLLEFFGHPPRAGEPELFSLAARVLQKAGHPELVPATRGPVMLRFSEEVLPRSLHEIFVEDQWQRPPYNGGALFKDRIVIVGASGNAAEDRLQTPRGTALGPTIHISAVNAALNRDFLHETSRAENIVLIAAGGALAWLLGFAIRRPMIRLVLLVAAVAGIYGLLQFLYNNAGFLPVVLSPLLALGTSGLAWSVWEQVLDLRDKARLRRTFERYVSRDVVKELVDNPAGWLNTLGGARKNITVLFSDVRGFTTITERGDAQALVQQLNEYFDEMVNIVFANHGTLDKFIGDAVMAQWGGIVSEGEQEDACRAVGAAVAMREALSRLNPGWLARGMPGISFGIGINHGEAIVGNLGAEVKKEVTAIGDVVNTASRLEGMTKEFHVDLLIGERVAALVRGRFFLRTVALSQPKGKTRPLEIFTVIGVRDGATEPAWLAKHEEAMRLYRARDFAAASGRFVDVLRELPNDWLADDYLQKCRAFAKEPPPPEWNAVHVMASK